MSDDEAEEIPVDGKMLTRQASVIIKVSLIICIIRTAGNICI